MLRRFELVAKNPDRLLMLLYTGAQGLRVPWVNPAAEAEKAVQSVKYHPFGIRGLAGLCAADYALAIPFDEYIQQANAETLVAIHLETAKAVEQLPEIVAVDGLAVVFIGPTDLSHSLGVPGQSQHPTVKEAMQQIVQTVAGSNAALGIMVGTAQAARE